MHFERAARSPTVASQLAQQRAAELLPQAEQHWLPELRSGALKPGEAPLRAVSLEA